MSVRRSALGCLLVVACTAGFLGCGAESPSPQGTAGLRPNPGPAPFVYGAVFSPDSRLVLTQSSRSSWTPSVWDVATAKGVQMDFRLADSFGMSLPKVFTPDGTLALSASGRTSLSLWTVGSGREVREFRGFEGVACLAVSPDGRLAAAGFRNGDIRLFRLPGGEEVRTFDVRQRLEPSAVMVSAIAFTRDGRRLLVNIGGLKLWDCETGETFGFFTGPTDQRLLAVSPDGRWAVSTRYDGPMVPPYALVLWDVSAGREVGQFVGHTRFVISAAFTADGQGLVSGGEDGTIRRWDLTSGQSLRSYLVGGKPLAFTSDGGLALVAGGCGIITLWDADQGKFLRLLEAPAYGYPNPGCESDRKSVLNMIQNILRTADVARRRNAAEDLGKLGLEAIPALNTALADADASVRQEAAAALRRLGR